MELPEPGLSGPEGNQTQEDGSWLDGESAHKKSRLGLEGTERPRKRTPTMGRTRIDYCKRQGPDYYIKGVPGSSKGASFLALET